MICYFVNFFNQGFLRDIEDKFWYKIISTLYGRNGNQIIYLRFLKLNLYIYTYLKPYYLWLNFKVLMSVKFNKREKTFSF